MQGKTVWVVAGLLCVAGSLWWLRDSHRPANPAPPSAVSTVSAPALSLRERAALAAGHPGTIATTATNTAKTLPVPGAEVQYRLSNTTRPERELLRNDHALLLANALIDTTQPLDGLNVPDKLRAPADNQNWIVQASGPLNDSFRALLSGAGAQIVSYIPNNAELVVASAQVAQQLKTSPLVAAVLPYEPYYKLTDPALLKTAVTGADLPADVGLRLSVFAGAEDSTRKALDNLGADVVSSEPGAFGTTTLVVHPAYGTFLDVAQLSGVMVVEAVHQRRSANDLMRARLNVAVNTVTNADYLGLSGLGVLLNINDSGVFTAHPDFGSRILLDPFTANGTDPTGHGTHVAGTILGNGSQSATVGTNASGSVTNADFRGMATNAQAFVIGLAAFDERPQGVVGIPFSDAYMQETAARTNVFISNDSWVYEGDSQYDMAAASYDAAVRDAIPEVTGPQPLLYVFSAGNSGGAGTDGTGGIADTILSPGTAKNVITVGAIEDRRNITNKYVVGTVTNQAWLVQTDSSNQVANFSSRGNVGVGIEGPSGRYKPDVVAPGTFVVSDRPLGVNWDTGDYYNPTNFTFNAQFNQTVTNNSLAAYSIVIPPNATSFTVTVETNDFSPSPFPTLPVFVRFSDNPTFTTFDATGTNTVTVSVPQLPRGTRIFYSVGNTTNGFVSFDLLTLVETTNNNGNFLTVLSNLNTSLGPFYRYESGTSMSAAGVSGMLALMQEFFEQRLHLTNHSPALLKALLINGARTVGSQYDFNVTGAVTGQGWGLPSLPNSIPGVLTNAGAKVALQFYDQTTNMLATGQSMTRNLALQPGTGTQPLRITLVWTDPPGNPAAGVKLVNDLDLIVTNTDNPANPVIFYGNDIPAGSDFNVARAGTNTPPAPDSVNNVENVYLFPPLGTNYSITVSGHRVNVNAVDSNTNNVVQDYALVVSYGDAGTFSNAFTIIDAPQVSSNTASLGTITNGLPLLNQRVGGNPQFTNSFPTGTNGVTGQWQFYVFTNTPSLTNAAFTNVAFVTFDPVNLGVPRMGTREEANPDNGVRTEADIDLYVSTDPALTNLNQITINNAFQSRSRTGTEKVLLTNQPKGQVYYLGVKSEDQQGAQYALVGVALTNSFGNQDSNGNVTLTLIAPILPTSIPSGTAAHPGSVTVLALTTVDVQARKVVVEDTVQHQEFGDLVGAVTHGRKTTVLNNHSFFVDPINDQTESFLYDDSGETSDPFLTGLPFSVTTPLPRTGPGAPVPRHTDGPGSLTAFTGDQIADGIWTLSMVNDSSATDIGFINNLNIFVEPQQPTNGFDATIGADSWFFGFIDVPAAATNLTINVSITSGGPVVDLYLRRGALPDANDFDKFTVINGAGQLTLGLFDSPPLNPGRYFVGLFNPTPAVEQVHVTWTFGLALNGPQPLNILSVGNEPLLDDAVTYSTNHVGTSEHVISAEVGVRIDHPRESDLVLTLVSPEGTRVLLAENRGGLDNLGYGSGTNSTNFFGPISSGGIAGATNAFDVTTTSGTLLINYQFFQVPDDMRIYYNGTRIFDSGLISGGGTFAVDFGPGPSTIVTIVMNEPGTNPSGPSTDQWNYGLNEISKSITYATFTEDTNKTTLPIKFAVPPFGGNLPFTPAVTNIISTFEAPPAGDYTNLVDGWTVVDTNPVKVVSVNALAANESNALAGVNVLALHNGGITRVLPTTAGRSYTLSFVSHGRPTAGPAGASIPVAWWKADGTPFDSSPFGNDGALQTGAGFAAGEVNQAFKFDGTNQFVAVAASPSLDVGPGGGFNLDCWINPLTVVTNQPLFEWNGNTDDSGIGLHFWISITPAGLGSGPGCLFANLKNPTTPQNNFILSSGPGLVQPGTFQHVALSYDKTSGLATLYYNGVQVAQAPSPAPNWSPITTAQLFLAKRIAGNNGTIGAPGTVFGGLMDEATIYSNALSLLQIQDVYAAGSAGKWLPSQGSFTVAANLILGGQTNSFSGMDQWTTNFFTFVAPSNNTVLTIQSINTNNNGMLVDSFKLVQNPSENTNNFFLPEETLNALAGESAQGDWKLEVLDNRLGATNPTPNLVSWQLSLFLEHTNPTPTMLTEGVPFTNIVPGNFVSYFIVNVPPWATVATNFLTVNSGGPVSLFFNQNFLPLMTNGGDVLLIPSTTVGGTSVLTLAGVPPLIPGQEYFLAVTNSSPVPATVTLEVDYDITQLINLTPITSTLAPIITQPRYFFFDVPALPAPPAVSFLLYNLSGNATLVASKGFPLPTLASQNYLSSNPGSNSDIITITPGSAPVPLSAGRWFLGAYDTDTSTNPLNYTIEAAILVPTIIPLTNDQRLTMTNVTPLQSEQTFFSFNVTTNPPGALFEVYGMTGDVDLTLNPINVPPFGGPIFQSSANPGTNNELIVIRTTTTGPANLDGTWYLNVPSQAPGNVTYTIHAVTTDTNGLLVSGVPVAPKVALPPGTSTGPTLTWSAVPGECYDVYSSPDLVNWTLLPIFPMPITATGTTISVTDPTPITGVPFMFYRIVQVPCP